MRQRLQVEGSGHRHHRHQQFALLAGGEQRLEHPRRLQAELFGSLQAIGRGFRVVFIAQHAVLGAGFLQQVDGWGHVSTRSNG
ncbi:hypothetical protein D3C76_1344440 [compost metagenome]